MRLLTRVLAACRRYRKRDGERRTLSPSGFDADLAAVHFDNPFRDRQAQPGSAFLRSRVVGLLELLEEFGLVGSETPGPVSRTAIVNEPLAGGRLHRDLARVGELDRVAHVPADHGSCVVQPTWLLIASMNWSISLAAAAACSP